MQVSHTHSPNATWDVNLMENVSLHIGSTSLFAASCRRFSIRCEPCQNSARWGLMWIEQGYTVHTEYENIVNIHLDKRWAYIPFSNSQNACVRKERCLEGSIHHEWDNDSAEDRHWIAFTAEGGSQKGKTYQIHYRTVGRKQGWVGSSTRQSFAYRAKNTLPSMTKESRSGGTLLRMFRRDRKVNLPCSRRWFSSNFHSVRPRNTTMNTVQLLKPIQTSDQMPTRQCVNQYTKKFMEGQQNKGP